MRWFGFGNHLRRLEALGRFLDLVLDGLALLEALESLHLHRGEVHENVFAALVVGDETEALVVVEPLDLAGGHNLSLLPEEIPKK
jgi:hypothetical protein